jgi:DNA ligase (NAD+)
MKKIDIETKLEEMIEIIEVLDTLYDAGRPCVHPVTQKIISDGGYDGLRRELDELKQELKKVDPESYLLDNQIFHGPSASQLQSDGDVVVHNPPLTSISKANGTLDEKHAILRKWMTESINELGINPKNHSEKTPVFVTAFKRDGVALALYYENGKLIKAGLRPRDGINGENVTKNAVMVAGIPKKLPIPFTGSIRGEVECRKSVFEKIVKDIIQNGKDNKVQWHHKKPPANPRNFTAGAIRNDDPKITKSRKLSFMGYAIVGHDNPPYKTEIERAKWCQKELGIPFVFLKAFHYRNLATMEKEAKDLDFEVDGTVISVNDLENSEQLGTYGNSATGNPKGKLAWKFAEEAAVVVVKEVIYQTGRTGRVTPVVTFDSVELAGTQVSKATAHNIGMVASGGIGIGAQLSIIKSGKIIPKIIKVVKRASAVLEPTTCPSCGNTLEDRTTSNARDLFCRNEDCPAQNVQTLVHYLMSFGCKGVGESMVSDMVSSGIVRCPADFYKLTVKSLLGIGVTRRMAFLTVARVHMVKNPDKEKNNDKLDGKIDKVIDKKKKIAMSKFIPCLGIPQASKGTGDRLADKYDSINNIMDASVSELENIADIGPTTAQAIHDYFEKHRVDIDELLKYVEIDKPKIGKFTGLKFCFTGEFPQGKDHWKFMCEEDGGKIASSMSKTVTHAVIGPNAGVKATKAAELEKTGQLKIIDVDELEKMLGS